MSGSNNAFDVLMAASKKKTREERQRRRHPYLVGVNACAANNAIDPDRPSHIHGLELFYSQDDYPTRWGKVRPEDEQSQLMSFDEDEHIIGVEFNATAGGDVQSIDLYTSHPRGRLVHFYVWSDGIEAFDDFGYYRVCAIARRRALGWDLPRALKVPPSSCADEAAGYLALSSRME